jgi:hypothetical protein
MTYGSPATIEPLPSGLMIGFSVLEAAKTTDAKTAARVTVKKRMLIILFVCEKSKRVNRQLQENRYIK